MSTLIDDEGLLTDMARTLGAIRAWFTELAEEHLDMDVTVIDGLLERYTAETGRDARYRTPEAS